MLPGTTDPVPARPPSGRPAVTAVSGSGAPPKALENRSRTRVPPTETRTVCRSVLSASTSPSPVNCTTSGEAAIARPVSAGFLRAGGLSASSWTGCPTGAPRLPGAD
ncbi:hypothetical protein [Saccharothrix longispora]|uniref:hypothetical protein n=1 Tax=Saccharothrix longispora TaxID=33920 RepID=UPI002905E01D|nr:hypothetical protein [Saccharothrix longispora]MBY8849330.1 hypothetical protein [Saccharothrix sp. MB29]